MGCAWLACLQVRHVVAEDGQAALRPQGAVHAPEELRGEQVVAVLGVVVSCGLKRAGHSLVCLAGAPARPTAVAGLLFKSRQWQLLASSLKLEASQREWQWPVIVFNARAARACTSPRFRVRGQHAAWRHEASKAASSAHFGGGQRADTALRLWGLSMHSLVCPGAPLRCGGSGKFTQIWAMEPAWKHQIVKAKSQTAT